MRIPKGRVTDILIGLNVAVWAVLALTGLTDAISVEWGFLPLRVSDALEGAEGLSLVRELLLTPITSAFLHAGILHLLMNMLLLLLTGRFVEHALGKWPYIILYICGIYGATLAQYLWAPHANILVVGASGAGSAVIAVYMLLYSNAPPQRWGGLSPAVTRKLSLLALWVILNIAIGFALGGSGIAVAIPAHIGGFIVGLLLLGPLLRMRYDRPLAGR